jgi:hypothetical protein
MWEQDIGVFPVDFGQQGDEWAHHVAIELTGHGHMAGRGTDAPTRTAFPAPLSAKARQPHPIK